MNSNKLKRSEMIKLLRNINFLIKNYKFDEAMNEIKRIKNKEFYPKFVKSVDLMERKLNENKTKYKTDGTFDNTYNKFFIGAKYLEYFGEYYESYQCYMAGAYLTNCPLFYYNAAVLLIKFKKYKKACELLEYYLKTGYQYLDESLMLIIKYKWLTKKEYKDLIVEQNIIDEIKSLIDIDYLNKMNNKYINSKLPDDYYTKISNKQLDDIINEFSTYSALDKILCIKRLFQNSYIDIANNLLKIYKGELTKDESCKNEYMDLINNKQLYINQSKH